MRGDFYAEENKCYHRLVVINGYFDKYRKLLKKIHFGPDDTLYVLDDVIDRDLDRFKIMLNIEKRPNVVNLMGNHEAMAIDALSSMQNAVQSNGDIMLTEDDTQTLGRWSYNDGGSSLADFLCLMTSKSRSRIDTEIFIIYNLKLELTIL